MPHAITRADVAGRDVSEHLQYLLRRAGFPLHTSAEFETIKAMKEELCYVAVNPVTEEYEAGEGTPAEYTLPDGTSLKVRTLPSIKSLQQALFHNNRI